MRLFNTVAELRHYLDSQERKTIGLVPTMGALHAGHLSLIEQARKDCQIVVVSIFVNPLQFGPNEDLERYPRPQAEDTALCKQANADAIFMPPPVELYGSPKPALTTFTQVIPPKAMTTLLCGHSRPTHFQGVATVVTKLLNIVRPTFAYFGQKDAQQVAIIKRLVADLNLPGTVVACPIVREPDGLALSSRNRYLTAPQRSQATVLQRSLQAVKAAFEQGETAEQTLRNVALTVLATEPDVRLDYLTLVHPDTLKPLQTVNTVGMMAIAAHVGKARLLDNVVLSNLERTPIIAIDGPAGAGKSTVARQIAHHLGLLYLDTGAMYRALTWFVLQQNTDPADDTAVAQHLSHCHIQLIANVANEQPQPPKVEVNGQDVTAAIRTAEVTGQVSTIAAQAAVRTHLVQQQQQYGTQGGVVADGRDIGTHVFPDAELKIFLTASVEERAQRRYLDLQEAQLSETGTPLPAIEELTVAIAERDHKDSTRTVSPLKKAPDAIEIVTDHLTAEQVIEKIILLYQQLTA
ncbi:MAG: bifunctional pantoate--beta-alanine ligase/(d)CMP kinase [Phormidesmis sp.]